jgi:hypothetical protein
VARKEFVRVTAPSIRGTPLSKMIGGYPTHPWWPLWNRLHGREDMTAEQIILSGPVFTSGIALDEWRVLAVAYGTHRESAAGKQCVVALESSDRGRTWKEIAVAARDDATPEGPDEASLVRLKDGRLYLVCRAGGPLVHCWSSDDGRRWTKPEPMRLIDEPTQLGTVWPVVNVMPDGSLIMVYGRPGKDVAFDPTGTGTQWQGRLDLTALELSIQAEMGVPAERRLRRPDPGVRYWDSSDYIAVVPSLKHEREAIVIYDVQHYIEHWNAKPSSAVRMLTVRMEGA